MSSIRSILLRETTGAHILRIFYRRFCLETSSGIYGDRNSASLQFRFQTHKLLRPSGRDLWTDDAPQCIVLLKRRINASNQFSLFLFFFSSRIFLSICLLGRVTLLVRFFNRSNINIRYTVSKGSSFLCIVSLKLIVDERDNEELIIDFRFFVLYTSTVIFKQNFHSLLLKRHLGNHTRT